MRPAILAAAATNYVAPETNGPFRLLVVGGSQGARIMSDIVPGAIERLEPALWSRLMLTQQVREEDMVRVRAVYDRLKIKAELAPFFTDLPARLASNHLVVSRSGAGTVAELAAIGRPSILVPLPGLDRPGPVRQCRRAVAGQWRYPDPAEPNSPPTGWPRKSPRSPPSRNVWPPWPPPPAAPAGSTPPSGWPIWW